MNVRTAIAALGMAAVLGTTASSALAQTQTQSNYNLRSVAGDISTAIMTLERDQRDFDGHRARAVGHLRAAHRQLRAAVNWARGHRYGYIEAIPPAPPAYRGPRYSQGTSDETLVNAAHNIPTWISELQGDARDYGGHREAAIDQLRMAETELNLAIQWFHTHGGY